MTLTAFDSDPFVEDPVACSLKLKSVGGGEEFPCPNVATHDSFITCAKQHDRTQHYCDRCHEVANAGMVDCRTCRAEGEEKNTCPITVIASFTRSNP